MKLTRGNIAALLLGVALAFPAFFTASWAKDQVVTGYPTWSEGDELWARKSGTTNTKQDLTSTGGALDVNIASGSPTPPTGASATQVQGAAADGAAAVGSPVQAGGVDGSGNVQAIQTDTSGNQQVVGSIASAATDSGNPVKVGAIYDATAPVYTTGQRTNLQAGARGSLRVEIMQNDSNTGFSPANGILVQGNVASGATDAGSPLKIGGVYTSNANQPAVTTGQRVNAQFDPAGNIRTAPQRPTATDVLVGRATVTATTGTTTLITVSAGRTWVGTLCASVDGNKAAAATGNGLVNASFLTTGTNVVPAAGTWFDVGTSIGANAATGVTGTQGSNQGCTQFTTVAPSGNTTTINYATTCTNTTACNVYVSAIGVMQ